MAGLRNALPPNCVFVGDTDVVWGVSFIRIGEKGVVSVHAQRT